MGNIVHNIAKGRVAELVERVRLSDPPAARLYVIPIDAGAATDDALEMVSSFAGILAAGATELTTGGWGRKTIVAADLGPLAPDDVESWMPADIPDQTWTTVTGPPSTDLVLCYAGVASPTNAQLLTLTTNDFVTGPDGTNVIAAVNDFFRATRVAV